MKQLLAPVRSPSPGGPPRPDSDDADFESDSATLGQRFATWLSHFVLYLSAVMTAGALGLYFLWRLPIPQEAAQLFRNAGDSPRPRPPSVVATPASPRLPGVSPIVVVPPVLPSSPIVATSPTEPATDPATAGVTEPDTPATPLAETPLEVISPPPQAEIEQLLAKAQQQMENRQLTAPASGNALRSYQRILELEADHPAALEGIERIAAYYRDIAEQTRQQGRLEESLNYIGRGLQASPKNERLLNLRREVRVARQREQEQRQARAEEARQQQQQIERDEQSQFRQRSIEPPQPWWQRPASPTNDSGFNQR